MRTIVFFILGSLVTVMQTTLFQVLPEWIGIPDLLFLLIVFVSIRFRTPQGALLVLLLGIGIEVFSGYFLGLYAIAYLFVFFVVKGLSLALSINEANHQPPVVAISYLFASGIIYVLSAMLAEETLVPWAWGSVLQRVLIITIMVVPVNRFYDLVFKICEKSGERRSFFRQRKGNRYRGVRN